MAGDKRKEMKCFLFSFIWNNLGWFLLPSRVVRVWMNCIRAISFQRSWKAHIIHLARKVDIFVFRDFGGFKFFWPTLNKMQKNTFINITALPHLKVCDDGVHINWEWLGRVRFCRVLKTFEAGVFLWPCAHVHCTHRSQQTSHGLTTWWVISIHAVIWILCHLTLFVNSTNHIQIARRQCHWIAQNWRISCQFFFGSACLMEIRWTDSSLEF